MELAKYKACICEGSAEEAIIDILVDNDLLIFNREEMLEERVIRCRSAKRFEERYLRKGFDEQISVIRILDSRREEFRLSKAYEQKIDVVNVITAPEIEMLIIHAEGAYDQFKRSGKKPSEFCKINLRMHDVKSYVNGQSIKHRIKPRLGEHQPNNPKLVYTMDFKVTPHMLRHTYITNLIYKGVDPKTVQYLAGHENSKTTMDIYAKVKYNKPEELSSVVNAAFGLR